MLLLFFNSVDPGTPLYQEPKFIVFYTMLLNLFSMFCFKCKEDTPTVTMSRMGTMVKVRQNCRNCGDSSFVWQSQPLVFNGQGAGNMLLSFAVLVAGSTISRIRLVFQHMGLSVISARTFFRHQRHHIFPLVLTYWKSYKEKYLSQVNNVDDAVWSGDGRFDSMGHSAKYGVYTMFNCNLMKILHFEVVQVIILY